MRTTALPNARGIDGLFIGESTLFSGEMMSSIVGREAS